MDKNIGVYLSSSTSKGQCSNSEFKAASIRVSSGEGTCSRVEFSSSFGGGYTMSVRAKLLPDSTIGIIVGAVIGGLIVLCIIGVLIQRCMVHQARMSKLATQGPVVVLQGMVFGGVPAYGQQYGQPAAAYGGYGQPAPNYVAGYGGVSQPMPAYAQALPPPPTQALPPPPPPQPQGYPAPNA